VCEFDGPLQKEPGVTPTIVGQKRDT
jgi:hypothetical protein